MFDITARVWERADADRAVALLRAHFPVVQDARRIAPQTPPFVDGRCDDPFSRLDLIPVFAPAAPAFRAISNDRHESRAAFAQIAAYDSAIPAQLGLAESLEERWVVAYAAQRFWNELLSSVAQVVRGEVQADGALREMIAAADVVDYWQRTRRQICGTAPEHTGQRWYPTSTPYRSGSPGCWPVSTGRRSPWTSRPTPWCGSSRPGRCACGASCTGSI